MTSYFATHEFDCHDGTPYPPQWVDTRLAALRFVLDPCREASGVPWEVVSGYRSPAYNKAVGGAVHSQHPEGLAADVRPYLYRGGIHIHWDHATIQEQTDAIAREYELVQRMIRNGGLPLLGGLGYYPGKWLHLDARPKPADGHIARWVGTGVGSEVA